MNAHSSPPPLSAAVREPSLTVPNGWKDTHRGGRVKSFRGHGPHGVHVAPGRALGFGVGTCRGRLSLGLHGPSCAQRPPPASPADPSMASCNPSSAVRSALFTSGPKCARNHSTSATYSLATVAASAGLAGSSPAFLRRVLHPARAPAAYLSCLRTTSASLSSGVMAAARAARFRRNVARYFARNASRCSGRSLSVPFRRRVSLAFNAISRRRSGVMAAIAFRRAALRLSNV